MTGDSSISRPKCRDLPINKAMRPHRPARGESRSPRNGCRPCPRRNGTPTTTAAVQRRAGDLADDLIEFAPATGSGHLDPAQVVVQPHPMVQLQRGVDELVPQRIEQVQPSGQGPAEDIEPEVTSKSAASMTTTFSVCVCRLGVSLYSSIASMPLSRFTTHLARSTIPRRSIAPYNCGGLADQIGSAILDQNHPMVVTGAQLRARSIKSQWCRRAAPNGRRWLTLAIGDAVKLAKLKAGRTTKTDWPIGRRTTIA